MGAWGHGLFDDDTACDVRDQYADLLREKGDGPAATEAVLSKWTESLDDPDDGPVVWLALAVTQHTAGRLEARVKREALRIIDEEVGLERWREQGEKELKRRVAALAKVRATLLAPQPPPKKIKPPFRDSCKWDVGELIGYQLQSGTWIVLRIVAHETHANGVAPVCELLEWVGQAPPTSELPRDTPVCAATLSTWSLFELLARNTPEYAIDPLAWKKLMAELGLLDPVTAGYSPLGAATGGASQAPDGFDWPKHMREMQKAIDKLKSGAAGVDRKLRDITRQRNPKLLQPVSQLALRREPGLETLPQRRLKRLKALQTPSRAGDWLVVRWHELDEALDRIFDLK